MKRIIQHYQRRDEHGRWHMYLITTTSHRPMSFSEQVSCYAAFVRSRTGFNWGDASRMHCANNVIGVLP